MLSKNKIKLIKSLKTKKIREDTGLFVVEGDKMVSEVISSSFRVILLAATQKWYNLNHELILDKYTEQVVADKDEIVKASLLINPQNAISVVEIPHYQLQLPKLYNKLSVLLDKVQDPGNLGTIIRIADWFGVEDIICSIDTADLYNPKVIQATMGAITRVRIHYKVLSDILREIDQISIPVFGTALQGENIYHYPLPNNGFILLGNESKGVNPEHEKYFTKQLFIPFFPKNQKRSESLNVAVAAGIICSEFRRREF